MSRQFWAYTEARRQRLVISSFGDIQLPSPWSVTQAMFFVALFIGMILTRNWWAPLIGFRIGLVEVVVSVVVPFVTTYALNLVQDDDRNTLLVIIAWLTVAFSGPARYLTSIRINRRCRQRVRFRP